MKAYLRNVRIPHTKANLVAGMIRGKKVTDALAILEVLPKKAAHILYKVVKSAASNARHNYSQNINDLYITSLLVTKGPMMKRGIPVSRGRMHPILKRSCHITVEVGLEPGSTPKSAKSAAPAPVPTPKPKSEVKVIEKGAKKKAPAKKTSK